MRLEFAEGTLYFIVGGDARVVFEEEWLADLASIPDLTLAKCVHYLAIRVLPQLEEEQHRGWVSGYAPELPAAIRSFTELLRAGRRDILVESRLSALRVARGRNNASEAPHAFALEGVCANCGCSREATAHFRWPECRALATSCVSVHGMACAACGFDFGSTYGPAGNGIVQFHSLRTWRNRGGQLPLDPVLDLRPICANCHAVIHSAARPYSLRHMRALVAESGRHAA